MAMKVRRIVTGHNASGKAVVKTDEQVTAVPRVPAGMSGCELWSTDQMPIDNSEATAAAQRAGFVKHNNYVGNGGGTTFRSNEWAPGHARFTHRTETLDYAIVLSGENDCEFDSGEVVHLKPGDAIGFSDQPHLNRQFRQMVQHQPGAVATPQCRLLLTQSVRDIE